MNLFNFLPGSYGSFPVANGSLTTNQITAGGTVRKAFPLKLKCLRYREHGRLQMAEGNRRQSEAPYGYMETRLNQPQKYIFTKTNLSGSMDRDIRMFERTYFDQAENTVRQSLGMVTKTTKTGFHHFRIVF